jgi:hypothetical protein
MTSATHVFETTKHDISGRISPPDDRVWHFVSMAVVPGYDEGIFASAHVPRVVALWAMEIPPVEKLDTPEYNAEHQRKYGW